MRKRYLGIGSILVALLFVGSGCADSDVMAVLEIAGGSQGITAADLITRNLPASLGGNGSTGDKDKDGLLDTADTINAIKKAAALEAAADAALAQNPPNYTVALSNIEAALALRPDDWGLMNRRAVIMAEYGKPDKPIGNFGQGASNSACNQDKMSRPQFMRCWQAVQRDRTALLEASRNRQKKGGSLVTCSTYLALEQHYDYLSRISEEEARKAGFSAADQERYWNLASQASAFQKNPGETCKF